MLLSDAILLGATLRPQAFGRMFTDEGSCALGAAIEAVGNRTAFAELWPWGDIPVFRCPSDGEECDLYRGNRLFNVITHLNDYHRWSREQIAEWVRTVEPAGPDPDPAVENEAVVCA